MPFFLFIIGRSMKWFTHKAVAVAGALAAGAHPAALFAVMIGSVLPDMVDTAMARGDKKVWRRIHRQTSHWFGWYLVIIILGFLIPTQRIVLDLLRATHITFPGVSPSALAQVSGIGNDLLVWVGIGGFDPCPAGCPHAHARSSVSFRRQQALRHQSRQYGDVARNHIPVRGPRSHSPPVRSGPRRLRRGRQDYSVKAILLETRRKE